MGPWSRGNGGLLDPDEPKEPLTDSTPFVLADPRLDEDRSGGDNGEGWYVLFVSNESPSGELIKLRGLASLLG